MARLSFAPLWIKLTGLLAIVILVGVSVTVVLARQGAATQVSHVMMGNRMVQPTVLQHALVHYYEAQGSWSGLGRRLPQLVASASAGGRMGGMMGHMMGMFDGRIVVLDAQGTMVASVGAAGDAAPTGTEQQIPLVVNGMRVGTLLIDGTVMNAIGTDEGALVAGVTRAVVIAALVAGLVALLLGATLIRQITRPLAALNSASQRIASGERNVRVTVESDDEVGQLARTFNRMAETLREQERLRRDLMADVAHELRTPLAGIQGTVEAMQDGVFSASPETLENIHEQVLLLNRLVEDLRTLAHAEAGQLALDLAPVDLAAVVSRQVAALRPLAQQKEIELSLHVADKPPVMRVDEKRLSQVLGNLLGNALRHTAPGGRLDVTLSAQEEGVQIDVVDSGEGIPAESLPHVFDRFYRGDRSRSRQTGGSGLGLAIARQLVDAHGGRIWAESPPPGQSQGSGFYVWLPSQAQEAKAK